jgi:MFS family permease
MRELLRAPGFGAYLAARLLARMSESALSILLGVAVYREAGSVLALGLLGLAQAVPAIALVLFGGHVADRHDRRGLAIATGLARGAMIAGLAAVYWLAPGHVLAPLYGLAFLLGVVGAFSDPALSGLEAQVVPAAFAVQGASLMGSLSRGFALVAPVLGGILYDLAGPGPTYAVLGFMLLVSSGCLWFGVRSVKLVGADGHSSMLANIAEGVRYVFSDQVIVGSMALDLFAVFFGGAAGLFPVFAEMLGVGSSGVGLMRGAASAGALIAMAVIVRHPPRRRAGVLLHASIAGFGVGVIVFGLSTNFVLSLAALFFVGLCDGLNVVIRQAIVRLAAPEGMRGRIAAVRMVFVNSSNELGEFESGMAAAVLGPVAATWGGGVIMLLVVAVTAWRAPKLWRLDLTTLAPRNA